MSRQGGLGEVVEKNTLLLASSTERVAAVPKVPGNTYRWQDGSTASSFTVREPGQYWVRVVNTSGCLRSDTARFAAAPAV
jgi:hypothetical protein